MTLLLLPCPTLPCSPCRACRPLQLGGQYVGYRVLFLHGGDVQWHVWSTSPEIDSKVHVKTFWKHAEETKAGNSILPPEEGRTISQYCSQEFALVFCDADWKWKLLEWKWNYLDALTRAGEVAKGQSVVSRAGLEDAVWHPITDLARLLPSSAWTTQGRLNGGESMGGEATKY